MHSTDTVPYFELKKRDALIDTDQRRVALVARSELTDVPKPNPVQFKAV